MVVVKCGGRTGTSGGGTGSTVAFIAKSTVLLLGEKNIFFDMSLR